MMNYRGRILTVSPTGEGGHIDEYICTAHYCDHIEIVPIHPGTEGAAFPPIALRGPGLVGVVYDSREDTDLIRRVKERFTSVLRGFDQGGDLFSILFPPRAVSGTKRGVQQNLARLESLDGDRPATVAPPLPSRGNGLVLDRVLDELFCDDNLGVAGKIEDSISVIGEHPDYTGKLVFIEIPLAFDEHGDSGEYIIVEQSPNSLYAVRTTCCHTGLEVVRIPFESGEHKVAILDAYEDDAFIREFIERLDDMDTEDYKPIECDLAETVSRQLQRMLERKLPKRPETMKQRSNMLGRNNCEAEDRIGCI